MKNIHLFVAVGVSVILCGGYLWIDRAPLETRIVDESAHVTQVQRILKGQKEPVDRLTTLPGYHYITAGTIWTLGKVFDFERTKTYHVRMLAVVYTAILFALLVYLLQYLREWPMKALLILMIPVLAPYLFLGYTEVLSLIFVLAAILLFYAKRYMVSGVMMFVALLVRQDNIVWIFMLLLWSAAGYFFEKGERMITIKKFIAENIWYVMSLGLFVLFLITNKGVAVGDKRSHPISVDLENVFFFLVLCGILFLPTILSYAKDMHVLVRKFPYVTSCVALFASSAYLLGFNMDHSYNNNDRFLHNYLGHFFSESMVGIVLGIIIMCAALVFLAAVVLATKQSKVYLCIAYAITVASLMLHPLMEHRYYIIPMVLFTIFLTLKSRLWGYLQIIYVTLITGTFYWVIFIKDLFKW